MTLQYDDLIDDFVTEALEHLADVESLLLSLETADDEEAASGVQRVFRAVHSVKGAAGFLGLTRINELAHAAENVLNLVRGRDLSPTTQVVDVLLKSIDQLRILASSARESNDQDVSELVQTLCMIAAPENAPKSDAPPAPAPAADQPAETKTVAADAGKDPIDANLRVPVATLDRLMNLAGELVLSRNRLLQAVSAGQTRSLESICAELDYVTCELQESIMRTRMQPIGNVWSKFPRVVRDLALQLKKQIRIDLEGKETELDKTILEAIKDPLAHLVRNSVDHGLETPAARVAAGKNAEGRLLLRAYHEGGQVNIEISDDGAGLNLERIRAKAVERGILSLEQATRLSDQEAAQLIFTPGFSTAEKITNVSGRGVGMDVVKTNIERIGGVIELMSQPGRGTTVKIVIPLTLAIIPALVVSSEGERYAIPQVSLMELVRLEGQVHQKGIEFIHGAPVYRLRGQILPLVCLSEQLQLLSGDQSRERLSDASRAINIVVLKADEKQFGLIVDRICDTEEIVVKPLGKLLKKIGEYAGATIMGDGGVALILDVKGLASAAGLGSEMRAMRTDEEGGASRSAGAQESVLVVEAGGDRRFALPISRVSRLEKIAATAVETACGAEVIQYRGAILPLLHLAEVVGGAAAPVSKEELEVVVYAGERNAYGLVVGRILDTCDIPLFRPESDRQTGLVMQTRVIQQRVTDVIDLDFLAAGATLASGRELCLEEAR